jgi:hypothetical protein
MKAGAAALLLAFAGAAMGIAVDRAWLRPAEAVAVPLTVEGMVEHLGLSPADETRVRALLDSMHVEVLSAADQGPDALAAAARTAHQRLEAALPEDARAGFRSWVEDHHRQLLERMRGGDMDGATHGPGGMHPGRGGGGH